MPLLRGESPANWRTSFYYHYYESPTPHRVPPHYGVVTDRHKLVHLDYPAADSYWELFDREADPQELESVWGRAEYSDVQSELLAELERLRRELKVPQREPSSVYGDEPVE